MHEFQGKLEVERCRGRPEKVFVDEIKDWTVEDMTKTARSAEDRRRWEEDVQNWVHQRPHRLRL